MAEQTRWGRLEQWIYEGEHLRFTAAEYAADVHGGVIPEASADIQDYLDAQRRRPRVARDGVVSGGSNTLFVLHRVPGTRTRGAIWEAGVSVQDARSVGAGFADDVKRTVMRAFAPDLARIGERNSRARRQIEAQIGQVVDGALMILESASRGLWDESDGAG